MADQRRAVSNAGEALIGAGRRAGEGLAQLASLLGGSSLRLGVTGLRRSGKTVFVTSLLHNLLASGRLPFLSAAAEGRYIAARLRPQPDADVPRFDYEGHLAALQGARPEWPKPTKSVSEIRIDIRYRPGTPLRRQLSRDALLTLDIIDYPGEWLLDLPLLGTEYEDWSTATLARLRRPPRDRLSEAFRAAQDETDPAGPADEAAARRLAELYTAFLKRCRDDQAGLSLLQPGRFLEPGEMAGAPVLTFAPLSTPRLAGRNTLHALMRERYQAYREVVVRRFFRDRFARLDRQIVLVDVLSALNAGAPGIDDLAESLEATLAAFDYGRPGWLSWLGGARIDKVLFAATKADHVGADRHGDLAGLLASFLAGPINEARFGGAEPQIMALASVKCTETVQADHDGRPLACVRGIPKGRDGPAVLFPGEVPAARADIPDDPGNRFRFVEFLPPPGLGADGRGLPNVRLDRALEFLIGDRLA